MTSSHGPLQVPITGICQKLNKILLHELTAFRKWFEIVSKSIHELFDIVLEPEPIFLGWLPPLLSDHRLVLLVSHDLLIMVVHISHIMHPTTLLFLWNFSWLVRKSYWFAFLFATLWVGFLKSFNFFIILNRLANIGKDILDIGILWLVLNIHCSFPSPLDGWILYWLGTLLLLFVFSLLILRNRAKASATGLFLFSLFIIAVFITAFLVGPRLPTARVFADLLGMLTDLAGLASSHRLAIYPIRLVTRLVNLTVVVIYDLYIFRH